MSKQDQQDSGTSVPKTATSVPERRYPDSLPSSPSSGSASCSEPLFDVAAAANYLGMSAKWVYRNYRRLTPILIGGGPKPRIKFRRCDLDEWVRRHRIQ